MTPLDARIADLEKKLSQARAKQQQIDAQKKAAQSKISRAEDTRKKILIGSVILSKVQNGGWPKEKFLAMMGGALTREKDRALFGLDAVPAPAPAPSPAPSPEVEK